MFGQIHIARYSTNKGNQNTTLKFLSKARTPRMYFASTEGLKSGRQKRDKITIQRNSARQHKAMTSDVIA